MSQNRNEPPAPLTILQRSSKTAQERPFEIVERKGLGHPDTICDSIMEDAARALVREYRDRFDRIQHFNLDKALLAAGESSPRFGGGRVDMPMRVVFGDRAVFERSGVRIPVRELVEDTARRWFRANLPDVDVNEHLVFQSEIREGSPELSGLFAAEAPGANDTSLGVGFAPLTETERLVLETERYLNGERFKRTFPETGQDIKVMAVRRDRALELTIAIAFIDRLVESEKSYLDKKKSIAEDLAGYLTARLERLDALTLRINALDEPGRGEQGVYLTVTGTSADGADSGEVGRGNRLTGFLSATRPWSIEAVAGKNPLCHVGKIYNHLAQRAAGRVADVAGVAEANVFFVSRIGAPLPRPQFGAVELVLDEGTALSDVSDSVEDAAHRTLEEATNFVADWLHGALPEQPA